MVGVPGAGINSKNKKTKTSFFISFVNFQFMINNIKLYIYVQFALYCDLTFDQVSLVFNLKYGYGTDIFTKQQKSDRDRILNFDVKVAQRTYINLVEISEKDLFRLKQTLYMAGVNSLSSSSFFIDCLRWLTIHLEIFS